VNKAYKDLSDGFVKIGQAFKDISQDVENPPGVKVLVMQIAEKMNLGDANLVEAIGFLKFCVNNDDPDMKKLAKELSGATAEEPKESEESKESKAE